MDKGNCNVLESTKTKPISAQAVVSAYAVKTCGNASEKMRVRISA